MNKRIVFSSVKLLLLVTIPITLLLLPGNFFDEKASLCLSVILFDEECYGCGLTRACMHLIHGDFFEAYAFNALSYIAFPVLAFQWAKWGWKEYKYLHHTYHEKSLA